MWAWVQHSRLSLIFNVLVVVAGLCAGDDHNSKHGVIPALAEFESKYKSQLADFANLRRHYNHSDHFSDIFPLPMTPHMHKRVLKLRNLLRTQDNDLKEVRGNRLARNDLKLRECRKKDIPGPLGKDIVPWDYKHQVVGHVFTDGLGHSLSTFLRVLYIAKIYGCRSALPNRFTVVRNYVFVPWDDGEGANVSISSDREWRSVENEGDDSGDDSSDDNHDDDNDDDDSDRRQLNRRSLNASLVSKFLAEHNASLSKVTKKHKQHKRMVWLEREPTRFLYCHQLHETKTTYKKSKKKNDYLLSEEFAQNMNCYIFYVDPWRVLCDVALGGHCSTERDELRPELTSLGDGNELANTNRRTLSMDEANVRRRAKKKELKKLKKLLEAGAKQRAQEAALESEAAADDSDTDTDEEQLETEGNSDMVDTDGIMQIKLAHWRKRGYPGYILLDKVINAKSRIDGLPGPKDNRTQTAVRRTLRRTQALFWDEVQAARRRNMAVQRNREQIEALGMSLAEMEWDCGYKGDNALDVAIHMRRGDLYQSQSEDDVDRYFSMDYYKDLLTRILHAWEASPALKEKFPSIRFHVHSESQAMPPPYGSSLELPEFEGVSFMQPENFHIHHHGENASLVCPVGKLYGVEDHRLRMRFCLNINPLHSLYCMAKANIFLASESYFSTLVAVTSPAVKIVPLSASQTFFDRKLCNGMGLCALEDRMSISDEEVSTGVLEDLLLQEDEDEEDASTSSI